MLSRIVNRTFVFFAVVYLTVLFVACGTAEVQEDYEKGLAAYETGDYTTATAHLMIAAEKDHPYAQFLLAQCFGNGKGVHVSSSRAAELRSRAINTFLPKGGRNLPEIRGAGRCRCAILPRSSAGTRVCMVRSSFAEMEERYGTGGEME